MLDNLNNHNKIEYEKENEEEDFSVENELSSSRNLKTNSVNSMKIQVNSKNGENNERKSNFNGNSILRSQSKIIAI